MPASGIGAVVRLREDGGLDGAFGQGGVVTDFGVVTQFQPFSIKTLPDGKVVVGGIGIDKSSFSIAPAFARLNVDGTPDASFGENGYSAVVTAVEGRAYDFDVLDDGRMFAVGPGGASFGIEAFATRVLPDGKLDTSFNAPDGYHLYVPDPPPEFVSEYMYAAHASAGGSLYSCGLTLNDVGTGLGVSNGFDFLLLRYTPEGRLDEGFADGGAFRLDYVGASGPFSLEDNGCYAVAEAPDGKVVLGGEAGSVEFEGLSNFVVMRLLPDGSPDPGFGDGGVLELDVDASDRLDALVVLPDGSIVVSGAAGGFTQNPVLLLVRPDGTLDPAFGDGGVYRFDRPNRGVAPVRVARQPDGKLVVTGNAPGAFVARLNAP